MTPGPVVALAVMLAASRPEVTNVEPPSWWTGSSLNPVRLLVRGRNLAGARLEGRAPGLTLADVEVNERGTYAFADLTIDPAARPGVHTLRLATAGGKADLRFEVLPPLARDGRFAGITTDDVVYLAMPDRFANGDPANDDPPRSRGLLDRTKGRFYHGGDLEGIRRRLPYLKDLGITALWLNPWYDNVDHLNRRETYEGAAITDYHGYGAVDFYAVDEHLGDLAELRELVDAAHAVGIKVVQDQVANHTGPYHPWATDPPTPTWFNGTNEKHLANVWQLWTLADPYATPEVQRPTLDGWFLDILPDLNQDDPEAARYIVQNALWWVGVAGLDGIRQDTLPYVHRRFWREWMAALKKEYPQLTAVGEMFDGDPALVSVFQGGRAAFDGIDSGFDTVFDFPLYYSLRSAFGQGGELRDVAKVIARDRLYPRPDELWTFLGLHDVERFMNEKAATHAGLKLGFTTLFTVRGVPLVYYGDEIALPGKGDPDNRRDFPGGFPSDARSAFEAAGRTAEEQDVFQHVRRLAALRRELTPLRRGSTVTLSEAAQTWAFARVKDADAAIVLLNNAREPLEIAAPVAGLGVTDGSLTDRLGGAAAAVKDGVLRATLPARSGAIYAAKLSK
ncbi:MAG TPA: alpha-amylase family glycosyl hydrolase [Vicinamibacteria bacterium]|nr:alpha-amylase family glycosyl hydrolase [Vicinamibacteria bacterium]